MTQRKDGIHPIAKWLVQPFSGSHDPEDMLHVFSNELRKHALPVCRTSLNIHTVHPEVFVRNVVWTLDGGSESQLVSHVDLESDTFKNSPVALIYSGVGHIRRRLTGRKARLDFEICRELAERGATDYLIMPLQFSSGAYAYISFATDAKNGFSEGQIKILLSLAPFLAIKIELQSSYYTTESLLELYLGKDIATEILKGTFSGTRPKGSILENLINEKTQLAKLNEQLDEQLLQLESQQQQLVHSAKLASLGTMAAGIVHELNNPLTVIKLHADAMASGRGLAKTPLRVKQIGTAADRMRKIVDHLRTFARKGSEEDWQPISVNEAITNSFFLLGPHLQEARIQHHLDLCDEPTIIWGDTVQLESAFQNLMSNSRDAFVERAHLSDRQIHFQTRRVDDHIEITYIDNAGGIDQDKLNRIFEPFYTTKAKGIGTGLGMSITHGIVQKHQGDITVRSRPGAGVEFKMRLPCFHEDPLQKKPKKGS